MNKTSCSIHCKKYFLLFVFLYLIIFSSHTFPQESVKYLTMENAISMALKDNNLIKANYYDLKKSSWDVKSAWSQMFPTINFNTNYNWIDKQTFAERDFRQYLPPELSSQIPQTVFQESYYSSFNLNFPIFKGVLINGLSIAYKQETISKQVSKSTKQKVIFNVITNYLSVLRNKDIVNSQNEFLNLSKLNYEKAQRLFKANRYSKNEVLRWKIDFQQQKSIVQNSKSDLQNSLLSLSRLINNIINSETIIDPNIIANLVNEKEIILDMNNDEITELINLDDDKLIQVNASLAALKAGEEISKLLHYNSYTSFLPEINLSYSYAWRENNTIDFDDYSPKNLMINFTFPIFSGFKNYTSLKSTLYEYKKNQEEFKDQLLNTKLILNNIVNNIINIKTQQQLLELNLEFNKNNYSIIEKQKEKGLVSNIDYIDAKLNMQKANIEVIANSYNFITSIVELYYLTGKIENLIY